jgi:hypothetical protein
MFIDKLFETAKSQLIIRIHQDIQSKVIVIADFLVGHLEETWLFNYQSKGCRLFAMRVDATDAYFDDWGRKFPEWDSTDPVVITTSHREISGNFYISRSPHLALTGHGCLEYLLAMVTIADELSPGGRPLKAQLDNNPVKSIIAIPFCAKVPSSEILGIFKRRLLGYVKQEEARLVKVSKSLIL